MFLFGCFQREFRYYITLDAAFLTQIGKHPRKPWKSFVTAANKAVAKDDAIDLLDQLLRYDHQEVSKAALSSFGWLLMTRTETDRKGSHETLVFRWPELSLGAVKEKINMLSFLEWAVSLIYNRSIYSFIFFFLFPSP